MIGCWVRRRALPVIAMCGAPAVAGAQVISGELFDAKGATPLSGALIRLALQAPGGESIVDSTISDVKGRFRFERSAPGVFRLIVGRVQREYRDPQLDSLAVGDIAVRRINLPEAFADAAVSAPAGDADVDARLTGGVSVRYPPTAFNARKNGAVTVFVQVTAGGRVSREPAPDVRGTDPDFIREVEQRLSRLAFTPAQRQGMAITQRVCLQFVFVRSPTPQRLPKITSQPDLATTDDERALCARFVGQRITVVAG